MKLYTVRQRPPGFNVAGVGLPVWKLQHSWTTVMLIASGATYVRFIDVNQNGIEDRIECRSLQDHEITIGHIRRRVPLTSLR